MSLQPISSTFPGPTPSARSSRIAVLKAATLIVFLDSGPAARVAEMSFELCTDLWTGCVRSAA